MFLTSRMGSTRPNVAVGYELDVITMVVLGGVSTAGGKVGLVVLFWQSLLSDSCDTVLDLLTYLHKLYL